MKGETLQFLDITETNTIHTDLRILLSNVLQCYPSVTLLLQPSSCSITNSAQFLFMRIPKKTKKSKKRKDNFLLGLFSFTLSSFSLENAKLAIVFHCFQMEVLTLIKSNTFHLFFVLTVCQVLFKHFTNIFPFNPYNNLMNYTSLS